MPTIRNTLTLDASPEVVFDLMADYERYPEWVAIVEEAMLVKGDAIQEGAENLLQWHQVYRHGPKRWTRWFSCSGRPDHDAVSQC